MTKEEDSKKEIPKKEPAQESVQKPVQQASKLGGSNMLLVIILIIVFVIAALGVGGYFGYKYWKNKTAKKTATTQSIAVTDQQKNLEALFKYPGATVLKSEKDNSVENTVKMEMETSDDVTTIYNYYLTVASLQKWGLGSREVSKGAVSAYINIKEKTFTAYLNMTMENSGKTKIDISFQTGSFTQSQDFNYGISSSTQTNSATGAATSGSYIISDSNTRIISESELTSLTPWQLKVARNEIYARYGRPFVHKDLQCYFDNQGWYHEDLNFTESELSTIENKNIATILSYEQKINSSLLSTDSGCHTN
jgi:flagellar basal body-associated protein FliL